MSGRQRRPLVRRMAETLLAVGGPIDQPVKPHFFTCDLTDRPMRSFSSLKSAMSLSHAAFSAWHNADISMNMPPSGFIFMARRIRLCLHLRFALALALTTLRTRLGPRGSPGLLGAFGARCSHPAPSRYMPGMGSSSRLRAGITPGMAARTGVSDSDDAQEKSDRRAGKIER